MPLAPTTDREVHQMKPTSLTALAAACIAFSAPASAYVFSEQPEPGMEIKIPAWKEVDKGKDPDQFKDLGGSWEVLFTAPLRPSST
jgi:hypothetical protein